MGTSFQDYDLQMQPRHFDGVAIYRAANQTIGSGVAVPITWTGTRWEYGYMFLYAPDTEHVRVFKNGLYSIAAAASFLPNATGRRRLSVMLNDSIEIARDVRAAQAVFNDFVMVSTPYRCLAGDTLSVLVFQDSGGLLDVVAAGNYTPEFRVQWVSG